MLACFAASAAVVGRGRCVQHSLTSRVGVSRRHRVAAAPRPVAPPRFAAVAAPPPAAGAVRSAAVPAFASAATIVGVCVLAGSFFYKVPQVVRLARRRSGEGLSVSMYSLETLGTTFSCLYFTRKAFAFSCYGELVFVVIQNAIILAQIVLFEKLNRVRACAIAAAYTAIVLLLLSPAIPLPVLMGLQIAAIPILNLARVPQILLNWRRKGTGELSPITLGLQVAGNCARIFTTLTSVGDILMLVGVLVSTAFNSTLVGQWIYYNMRTAKARAT